MSPAALPPDQAPILEVYYAPSCAPCRLELPAVAEFAKSNGARVRIEIVSDEIRARREISQQSVELAENADANTNATPRAILRSAGDSDSILPYSRSLGADGKACAAWRGRLTLVRARALVSACAHAFISRPSRRS